MFCFRLGWNGCCVGESVWVVFVNVFLLLLIILNVIGMV